MVTITDILNQWNNIGVFSYVLPFLVVFAVIFAILEKTKIFGQTAKGINAVIAVALGLLSLLNDYVSTFFATIAPRLGVMLAIVLVIVILVGLFASDKWNEESGWKWVGIIFALIVIIWALNNWWPSWFGGYGFAWSDNLASLVALALLGVGVWAIVKFSGNK